MRFFYINDFLVNIKLTISLRVDLFVEEYFFINIMIDASGVTQWNN